MRGDRGICHFVRNSMLELLIYFIRRKNWTRFFSIYSESWLNVKYISGPIFPRVGNLVRDYFSCGKIYAITPVWKSIQQHWIEMSVLGYMLGSRKSLSDPHMHEFFPCVWLVWFNIWFPRNPIHRHLPIVERISWP